MTRLEKVLLASPAVALAHARLGRLRMDQGRTESGLECGPDGMVFVVRTPGGEMRAHAEALADVDMVAHRRLDSTRVGCGAQAQRYEE